MSAREFTLLVARFPKRGYNEGDAVLTLRALVSMARAIGRRPDSAPRQRVRPGVPWLRLVVP
jgi:hypothetical protein